MKKIAFLLTVASMFTLLVVVQSFAEKDMGSTKPTDKQTTVTNGHQSNILRSSEIIGRDVHSVQGKELGKIEELVIDQDGNRVEYAVLSSGGMLGVGDQLFAVPMTALEMDSEKNVFVLNISAARLKNAPGFEKNNWPNMEDQNWQMEIDEFYGQESGYQKESSGT